ncbi:MAG: cation diffusion facilitator family transporter [Carnobacterium sp.]|uniref:Cation diffusion facilitator family transporter n=1 Tax=Carnobacterium maltaromaticum TaxID=2751 RepID=A0AAW9K4F6_CARML|nr:MULTISPECIES: cation diffusion facilitator family transporter [Carnobacterium]KRN86835.1 cation diffusion facilitator family transporter [Carnobacterium maltaromaticum]MBQ6485995.1 cation transporter [Carnobacterium sp.]MDT1946440.1 cation diffusion facilitator family transporter [Carnobacterium maltaromaticum]MDT2000808.1 cation diffusion facilitator family transporter [Carnobacterium maltaromaticum]MDW5525261.1 cation diffusion facilitator family transporter [Carnobacterium maltaromaticum
MITYLINRFERKHTGSKEALRPKLGAFAGRIGLLSNLVLFLAKFVIGLLSGSVSIMADAINNLSDTISSILTLVGFYISGKPADAEHPYGHERFEYISGMLVSILITFVGFQFLITSIERIRNPQSVTVTWLVLIILLVSIGIKIWQGLFYQKVAKKIDSDALVASAKDSLNDVFTTVTVLVSAMVEGLTGLKIDGYVGLAIAIYIIYSGYKMIMGFVNELMGMRPAEEEINQIKERLSAVDNIIGYHDLLIHNYGPNKTFASVHIEIDDTWNLRKAHEKTDLIEREFKKELGIELVCHVDPVSIHDQEQNRIHLLLKEIINGIDDTLKMHDLQIEKEKNEAGIMHFDIVIPKGFGLDDQELTQKIQLAVTRKIGDYQVQITFDHVYLLV